MQQSNMLSTLNLNSVVCEIYFDLRKIRKKSCLKSTKLWGVESQEVIEQTRVFICWPKRRKNQKLQLRWGEAMLSRSWCLVLVTDCNLQFIFRNLCNLDFGMLESAYFLNTCLGPTSVFSHATFSFKTSLMPLFVILQIYCQMWMTRWHFSTNYNLFSPLNAELEVLCI